MKIVQSFWSQNFYDFQIREAYNNCPAVEHEIYSRALSCLLLSRYYDHIELVTDIKGKELLVAKLGLPYTSVILELDKLDKYSPELFVLDEIYAMGIQNEPFIYVDENIFLWSPLASELSEQDLFTLYRYDYDFFIQGGKKFNYSGKTIQFNIKSQFENLDSYLYRSMSSGTYFKPQCGILGFMGGCSNSFFREYSREVFSFTDKYMPHLNDVKYISDLNSVLIRSLFNNVCKKNKVTTFSYTSQIEGQEGIDNLFSNKNIRFHHFLDTTDQRQLNELEFTFRFEFPEHYYRIQKLLKEKAY